MTFLQFLVAMVKRGQTSSTLNAKGSDIYCFQPCRIGMGWPSTMPKWWCRRGGFGWCRSACFAEPLWPLHCHPPKSIHNAQNFQSLEAFIAINAKIVFFWWIYSSFCKLKAIPSKTWLVPSLSYKPFKKSSYAMIKSFWKALSTSEKLCVKWPITDALRL